MADGGYLGLELIMSKPARQGAEQMTFTRGRPERLIANFPKVARLLCRAEAEHKRQTMLTTFKRKKDRKKKYGVFGSSEKCDEGALWWETQRYPKGEKKGMKKPLLGWVFHDVYKYRLLRKYTWVHMEWHQQLAGTRLLVPLATFCRSQIKQVKKGTRCSGVTFNAVRTNKKERCAGGGAGAIRVPGCFLGEMSSLP